VGMRPDYQGLWMLCQEVFAYNKELGKDILWVLFACFLICLRQWRIGMRHKLYLQGTKEV
jgi:hypothetical protein